MLRLLPRPHGGTMLLLASTTSGQIERARLHCVVPASLARIVLQEHQFLSPRCGGHVPDPIPERCPFQRTLKTECHNGSRGLRKPALHHAKSLVPHFSFVGLFADGPKAFLTLEQLKASHRRPLTCLPPLASLCLFGSLAARVCLVLLRSWVSPCGRPPARHHWCRSNRNNR